MSVRTLLYGWKLPALYVLLAAGCASSGASSSSSSWDWEDFVGNYRFESRLRGGNEMRGTLTLHTPELYTVYFEVPGLTGRSCREVRNMERSNEVWAELQGNRLLLSCKGALFRVRRAGKSLDGTARLANGDRGTLRFERITPQY